MCSSDLRKTRFDAVKDANILDRASLTFIQQELTDMPTVTLSEMDGVPVLGIGKTAGLTAAMINMRGFSDSPKQRFLFFQDVIKRSRIEHNGIIMAPEYYNTGTDFQPLSESEITDLIRAYKSLSHQNPGILFIPGTFLVDLGDNRIINRAIDFYMHFGYVGKLRYEQYGLNDYYWALRKIK